MQMRYFLIIFLVIFFGCSSKTFFQNEILQSDKLNIPIVEVQDRFLPYHLFCQRFPAACNLSGGNIIQLSPEILTRISDINSGVNNEIEFKTDKDQYQLEEFWNFPEDGLGDCEDIALEKRSRLVELGFPRGALRIAIAHHKKLLTAHALLTVETNKGTYIMDSENDLVQLWHLTPYNFETRERQDNRWDRFDQTIWNYID